MPKEPEPVLEKSKSTVKQGTTWNTPSDKIKKKDLANIDYSKNETLEDSVKNAREQYLENDTGDGLDKNFVEDDQEISLSESESEDEDVKDKKPQKKGLFSKFTSSIKNITGNMVLYLSLSYQLDSYRRRT